MRKLLVIALLLGTIATAANLRNVAWSFQAASLTETPPSADPDIGNTRIDGVSSSAVLGAVRLRGNTGYRLTLCANTGQTLSGAGSLQIYYCPATRPLADGTNPCAVTWPRHPSIDEAVTVTAISCNGSPCRCQTFDDRRASGLPDGWIRPVVNAVTTSGGTTPVVLIEYLSQT